jgi:hypothetical protein
MKKMLLTMTLLSALASAALAQPAADAAPEEPANVDPAGLEILKRLEKAPQRHKTFQADTTYAFKDMLTLEQEYRWGDFTAAMTPSKDKPEQTDFRFALVFNTFAQDEGPRTRDRQIWAFDGKWLTNVKFKARQILRIQVAGDSSTANPFRLGQGPMVLPIGQKVRDVIAMFEVHTERPRFAKVLARFTRPDVTVKDLDETDYILLVTRDKAKDKTNHVAIEMWIDRKTDLPVQSVAYKGEFPGLKGIKQVTYGRFENYKLDEKIDPDVFLPPNRPGFQVDVKPLRQATPRSE